MCIYMLKKPSRALPRFLVGVISVHTNILPQMHASGHMMQDIKYSKQVSFPFMAFEFL